MWLSFPTEARHPPSCCGRVIARPAKPETEPSPTCPAGLPSASSNSAPCCAATNCCPPPRRWKSSARCRTATCWPHSAPHAASRSTPCCRAAHPLDPAAKLATARMLDPTTASHSLGEMLELGKVSAKEIYATLDWLGR